MRLLIVVVMILSVGCSHFNNEQIVPETYVGEWHWEKSVGGIGGWTIHSDSVDFSERIKINQSNELFWYRDGNLIQKFKISEHNEEGLLIVPTPEESHMSKIIRGIQSGSLVIRDTCTDCYHYYFIR